MQTAWIPTTSDEIDARWLNDVLPVDIRDGGVVVAVSAEIIGGVARLTLAYEGAGPAAVTSVIAKRTTATEHRFYAEVAPRVNIGTPRVYANLHVLLLEDLSSRRCGDRLASCSWGDATVALGELARHHAAWWQQDDPFDTATYWALTRTAYLEGLPGLQSHALGGLAERLAEHWDAALAAAPLRAPLTLVHGDVGLDNMLFRDHDLGTEFTLLDWQTPHRANPMGDVVHFLAGNFEPAWRRRHQAELVRIYHGGLVGNGVVDYTFEDCWRDYRAHGLVLLVHLATRGDTLPETVFRRLAEAVEDLGAAAFLPG